MKTARRPAQRIAALALPLLVALSLPARGQAEAEEPDLTRQLEVEVERWQSLRRQLVKESGEWKRESDRLGQELDVLRTETVALGERLKLQDEKHEEQKERLEALRERRRLLLEERTRLAQVVAKAETSLQAWAKRIPPALLAPLRDAFAELSGHADGTDNLPVRLRNVVTLYTEIARLQNSLHVVRDRVQGRNNARETDVLYVGLSCGFAASADGQWAAAGRPGKEQWVWNEDVDLAPVVREAIAIHSRRTTPRLVELPLGLGGYQEDGP